MTRGVALGATSAFILAAAFCAAVPKTFGQAAPAAPAPAAAAADEEVIELDPFSVSATAEDAGYSVKDTLAGTRVRTELKDVSSAVSVVNAQFLKDTGAKKSEDLLIYTTGTEVGGMGGNFVGAGSNSYLDTANARLAPQNNTRVRGLDAADNTRNYFITDIPWDGYNVDQVTIQRGPNAILFGMGSPAGLVNSGLVGASFKNTGKFENRVGSFGTIRDTLDLNYAILKDELAVHVAAVDDHTYYKQKPAFNQDRRVYGALRFDPKFLRGDGSMRTSIKVDYEYGDVTANRPRVTPPVDAITPWFNDLGKKTYNAAYAGTSDALSVAAMNAGGTINGAGARNRTLSDSSLSPNWSPWLGAPGRLYDNLAVVYPNYASELSSGIIQGSNQKGKGLSSIPGGSFDSSVWGVMMGILPYDQYASYAELPNSGLGVYKVNTLSDASIFDFYNKLLDGPNKREWQRFDVYNLNLSQTFFNNRLGFEAAYDKQNYHEGQFNMLSQWAAQITVDINDHLPDGSVNPNVGRPMVVSDSISNNGRDSDRAAMRFTGFGELNFSDFMGKNTLSNILGRHMFTAVYSDVRNEIVSKSWAGYSTDDLYGSWIGTPGINSPNRQIATISYLGSDLRSLSTAHGANISNLQAVQTPTSGIARMLDATWNASSTVLPTDPWTYVDAGGTSHTTTQVENPANYRGWQDSQVTIWNANTGDIDRMYTTVDKYSERIKSQTGVWQGYFWDGTIIPMVGWRKDTYTKDYGYGSSSLRPNASVDIDDPSWDVPTQFARESVSKTSWGIVVHTPKFLKEKMPLNTDISGFYNKSSNFRPGGGRVDVLGDAIASPSGETKDYGFAITTLNDKLTLKVTWYETSMKNANLDNFGGTYMIWGAEAWGYLYAKHAQAGLAGTDTWGFNDGYTPGPGQTVAQALDEQKRATDAFFANLPSDKFYAAWKIDRTQWNSWMQGSSPSGFAFTGDTKSKGTEYELIAQPTKNWNITLNASKTSAQRVNIAQQLKDWVDQRWTVYSGDAGLVRLWGVGYSPGETVRGKFEREFMAPYRLYRLQENSDVPELRPWHFNAITNYSFSDGALKGFNVGGAYRWVDGSVLGYPVVNSNFDLAHPYIGKSEDAVDLWVGYSRKLTSKVNWNIQLNVKNAFASKDLIPVTVQPDGTPATCRIPEPMTWTLTNTFSF